VRVYFAQEVKIKMRKTKMRYIVLILIDDIFYRKLTLISRVSYTSLNDINIKQNKNYRQFIGFNYEMFIMTMV